MLHHCHRPVHWLLCVLVLAGAASRANAQPSPELQQILQRLDRIESQNRELMTEIQALRQQLDVAKAAQPETPAPEAAAPLAERVEVQDQRIAQQDQEKI